METSLRVQNGIKYLNLSPDFDPFFQGSDTIEFKKFTFSGGEPHIKIDPYAIDNLVDCVSISHRINSFNDLGEVAVTVDALRRIEPDLKLHLVIPYFPGARQDRIMVDGEPFTVKVYADIINAMKLDEVTILDPHSEVTPALLNNVTAVDNHRFVLEVLKQLYPQRDAKTPILISPDAGANKKVLKLAKYLSYYNVIDVVKCDKTRDVRTGEITNFEVYADDLGGRDCIIVDDICDGGGTFIGLAKKLKEKNCGKLYLAVTHGIFSNGFKVLNEVFDGIFTTDSIKNYDESFLEAHQYHKGFMPNLHEIKIKTL